MSQQKSTKMHSVVLEKRQKLNMSGVSEVVGFDDETVVLKTDMGKLTVKGEGLKIGAFSTSDGQIDIDGETIIALVYASDENEKGGFLRRLMR